MGCIRKARWIRQPADSDQGRQSGLALRDGYIQELVVIRRQMAKPRHERADLTMTAGASYPEFGQNLGPLANNVSTNAWWHPSATYKDDYIFGGARPTPSSLWTSTRKSRHISKQRPRLACEVAGGGDREGGSTDAEAVRKQLSTLRFETFYGPIQVRSNGPELGQQPDDPADPGGKYIVLDPQDVKTGELKVGVGPQ